MSHIYDTNLVHYGRGKTGATLKMFVGTEKKDHGNKVPFSSHLIKNKYYQ